jgi:UrcA family protein
MSILRFAPLAAAALALSAASAFAAPAAPDGDSFKISVRSADLNLGADADAKVLLRRIQSAAGHACGGKPDLVELSRMRVFKLCVGASVDETVARIGNPRLTALNDQSRPPTTLALSR